MEKAWGKNKSYRLIFAKADDNGTYVKQNKVVYPLGFLFCPKALWTLASETVTLTIEDTIPTNVTLMMSTDGQSHWHQNQQIEWNNQQDNKTPTEPITKKKWQNHQQNNDNETKTIKYCIS